MFDTNLFNFVELSAFLDEKLHFSKKNRGIIWWNENYALLLHSQISKVP